MLNNTSNKQQTAFSLVTTPNQKTIKISSLYNLVEDLLLETTNNILSGYKINTSNRNTPRQAFFIQLPKDATKDLFAKQGYQLKDQHLTIDKFFANASSEKAKQGFTACHYTAVYENVDASKKIVLHQYIDRDGNFTTSQAKLQEKQDDSVQTTSITLTTTESSILQTNSISAQALAQNLAKEKIDRYLTSLETARKTELFLTKLSTKILTSKTKNDIDLYLQFANKFNQQTSLINRYNDQETDQRAEKIVSLCQYLKEKIKFIQQENNNKAPVAVTNTENKDATEPNKKDQAPDVDDIDTTTVKQTKLALHIRSLVNEITTQEDNVDILINRSKTLSTEELVSNLELVATLKLKLVELAILSEDITKNKLIKRINNKLEKIPSLVEKFEQAVADININSINSLFPFMKEQQLAPIFKNVILGLISSSKTKGESLIQVCNYFYANSLLYKSLVKLIADNFLYLPEESTFARSLLMMAYTSNNLAVFTTLLDHGADPNCLGVVEAGKTFPLLHVIACFHSIEKSTMHFLQALLDHGANIINNVNTFRPATANNSSSYKILNKDFKISFLNPYLKSMKLLSDENNTTDSNLAFTKLITCDSALAALCKTKTPPKIEFLKMLLPGNDLSDLAQTLVILTDKYHNLYVKFVASTTKALLFASSSKEIIDQLTMKISAKDNTSCLSAYFIYTTNDNTETRSSIEHLEVIIKELRSKYATIESSSPTALMTQIDKLIAKVKKSDNLQGKINLYEAAFILIAMKNNPTLQDKIKMVELLCEQGTLAYNAGSESKYSLKLPLHFFNTAKLICQTSAFSLQTSMIYEHACVMHSTISHEITTGKAKTPNFMLTQFSPHKSEPARINHVKPTLEAKH